VRYYAETGWGSSGRSSSTADRAARRAQRSEEIARAEGSEERLMTAHRQRFRDTARPQASAIDPVSAATFLAEHKRIAVEGIPRYRRYERSVATELAHSAAAW